MSKLFKALCLSLVVVTGVRAGSGDASPSSSSAAEGYLDYCNRFYEQFHKK